MTSDPNRVARTTVQANKEGGTLISDENSKNIIKLVELGYDHAYERQQQYLQVRAVYANSQVLQLLSLDP